MKVSELIAFLNTCDQDAVVFLDDLGGHDEMHSIERPLACRSPDNLDSWVLLQFDSDANDPA